MIKVFWLEKDFIFEVPAIDLSEDTVIKAISLLMGVPEKRISKSEKKDNFYFIFKQ
jgi:hypothetical protein